MSEYSENALAAYKMREAFHADLKEKEENARVLQEAEYANYERIIREREKKPVILAEFKSYIRDNLLKYVVEDMMSEALNNFQDMDAREINRMHAFTEAFIKDNGGAWSILRKAGNVSAILEEVGEAIETETQEIFDKCDKSDCGKLTIDGKDLEHIIGMLNKKEDYEAIKQEIANKVTNAEIGFVAKKQMDDAKMQEVIQKAEERVQNAEVDPMLSKDAKEAIQQEASNMVKRARVSIYEDPNRTLYEEMIHRFSKSVMDSDVLRESYAMESGRMDFEKITASVRTMYTILETFNTAKLMKIDEAYIKQMLDEM